MAWQKSSMSRWQSREICAHDKRQLVVRVALFFRAIHAPKANITGADRGFKVGDVAHFFRRSASPFPGKQEKRPRFSFEAIMKLEQR
jgi:hypothetical protein